MKLSFSKGQSLCLQLLIVLTCGLALGHLGVTKQHSVTVLLTYLVAYLSILWVRRHTWRPKPKSSVNSYQISQSVSIILPDGWSLRTTDTHAYLDHGYTDRSYRIFIGSLSPRQIHTAINNKLLSIYHD